MKRLPIIRHVRWFYHIVRLALWWNGYGRHLGMFVNPADEEHLERIWRGEA